MHTEIELIRRSFYYGQPLSKRSVHFLSTDQLNAALVTNVVRKQNSIVSLLLQAGADPQTENNLP